MKLNDRPVGRAVTRSSLEQEVKSRASQVRQYCQRLATAATFLSKGAVLLGRNDAKMGPQTHYMLQRNTASIKKNLILI